MQPDSIEYYDEWLHLAFALRNTICNDGWPIFQDLSSKNTNKYNAEACAKKWFEETRCTEDGKYGLWSLFEWARRDSSKDEFRRVMCGVHDKFSDKAYSDGEAISILRLLETTGITKNDERVIKLCLQQYFRDRVVVNGQKLTFKRCLYWENKEAYFEGQQQTKFAEAMRARKAHYAPPKDDDDDDYDDDIGSVVSSRKPARKEKFVTYTLYDAMDSILPELCYEHVAFYPTTINGETGGKVDFAQNDAFNLFMGFRSWKLIRNKVGYKNFKNVEIILKHLYEVLYYNDGDKKKQKETGGWFIQWLASKYCRPWEKTDKTPSFVSPIGGLGKSAVILWLMDFIFGTMYVEEVTESTQLGNKFNARDRFVLIVFFDDMREALKLKAMQTRKRKRIEHKGVDVELMMPPDFADSIVCNNQFNPVELDRADRRNIQSECFTGLSSHTLEGKIGRASCRERV